jgi:hypothetical protein
MSSDPWKPRGPIGFITDLLRDHPGACIFWTLFAAFLFVMLFGHGWFLPTVEPPIPP